MFEAHPSYGFFTKEEFEFMRDRCPRKYKAEFTRLKRRAAVRKRGGTPKVDKIKAKLGNPLKTGKGFANA